MLPFNYKNVSNVMNAFIDYYVKDPLELYTNTPLFKPRYVRFELTHHCNLNCPFCDIRKLQKKEELSTSKIKEIIADLKINLKHFYLLFNGGEQFLKEDLMEILDYAARKSIRVMVQSNGTLITRELARKIMKSKIHDILLPLDHVEPAKIDLIRRYKGDGKKVLSAVDNLLFFKNKYHSPVKIRVITMINNYNVDSVERIIQLASEKGIDSIFFCFIKSNFFPNKEYGKYWFRKSPLWPKNKNEVHSAIASLIKAKKSKKDLINNTIESIKQMEIYFKNPLYHDKKCPALEFRNFVINPYGEVRMSDFYLGDLNKHKLRDILNKNNLQTAYNNIKRCKKPTVKLNQKFDIRLLKRIKDFPTVILKH